MSLNSASPLAIIGFILISLSLIFLIIGYLALSQKKYHRHKYFMISATTTNSAFLVFYVMRYVQEGNTPFPGPDWFYNFVYVPILTIHILTAILSIYFVLNQIFSGWKGQTITTDGQLQLSKTYQLNHIKNGKKAVTIWGISFLGGISVFMMLYVIF